MYAGGAGAILPKTNHLQAQLPLRPQDARPGPDPQAARAARQNGYKDVEIKLIGDVPWSRGSSPTRTSLSSTTRPPRSSASTITRPNPFFMASGSNSERVLPQNRRRLVPLRRRAGRARWRLLAELSLLRRRPRREGRLCLHSHGHGSPRRPGRTSPRRQRMFRPRRLALGQQHGRNREDRRRRHLGVRPNHPTQTQNHAH